MKNTLAYRDALTLDAAEIGRATLIGRALLVDVVPVGVADFALVAPAVEVTALFDGADPIVTLGRTRVSDRDTAGAGDATAVYLVRR